MLTFSSKNFITLALKFSASKKTMQTKTKNKYCYNALPPLAHLTITCELGTILIFILY